MHKNMSCGTHMNGGNGWERVGGWLQKLFFPVQDDALEVHGIILFLQDIVHVVDGVAEDIDDHEVLAHAHPLGAHAWKHIPTERDMNHSDW